MSHLYDSTVNAVIVAENKPAYNGVNNANHAEYQNAYENEQFVDFFLPSGAHSIVVFVR